MATIPKSASSSNTQTSVSRAGSVPTLSECVGIWRKTAQGKANLAELTTDESKVTRLQKLLSELTGDSMDESKGLDEMATDLSIDRPTKAERSLLKWEIPLVDFSLIEPQARTNRDYARTNLIKVFEVFHLLTELDNGNSQARLTYIDKLWTVHFRRADEGHRLSLNAKIASQTKGSKLTVRDKQVLDQRTESRNDLTRAMEEYYQSVITISL